MKDRVKILSRVWLVNDEGEVVFGGGRARILKAIDETGSLSQAAKKLGMSYRAVWGKVKTTEDRLGATLLTRNVGRCKDKNTRLTPAARLLIDRFEQLENATRGHAENDAEKFFDFDLSGAGAEDDPNIN
jgi:molybdate transport system regulatory protein